MLPVTAVVVGWVALGQKPSLVDFGGIIAVLIGVSLQERDAAQLSEPLVHTV
jgi:drug/metabolite transporter (DMT)-like permease